MKSIAILYASEGTGHKSAAEALRDRFLMDNPDGHVLCRDVLDYIPRFMHRIVSDGYLFMARRTPWAWGWFYWSSDRPSLQAGCFDKIHDAICARYMPLMEADMYREKVEAVFFTHYFAAANIAVRNSGRFPVFYVNTDFVCHRFQRSKVFRASFVASPIAVKQHLDDCIAPVVDAGIPIAPKYASLPSKEEARRSLGVASEEKLVIVSGGGIGAGSVMKASASLSASPEIKTIVICGNNKQLYGRLADKYARLPNIKIVGFVPDMEKYYAAADLGIMKPGGLSLSESLAARLPLLLMDPIPGQEQLNMDYVGREGAALPLASPSTAACEAVSLLSDSPRMAAIHRGIEKISRPNAAAEILKEAALCL